MAAARDLLPRTCPCIDAPCINAAILPSSPGQEAAQPLEQLIGAKRLRQEIRARVCRNMSEWFVVGVAGRIQYEQIRPAFPQPAHQGRAVGCRQREASDEHVDACSVFIFSNAIPLADVVLSVLGWYPNILLVGPFKKGTLYFNRAV